MAKLNAEVQSYAHSRDTALFRCTVKIMVKSTADIWQDISQHRNLTVCCVFNVWTDYFFLFGNPKSLIRIVLSTTSILKSDHTGGCSRFNKSSFANLFFKIEWTCAPLNRLPRTVRYLFSFNHSAMASKVMPFSRCSEMV